MYVLYFLCSCLISGTVHSSHMKNSWPSCFCCVCVSFPVEGWDTRTLVSTPFTEPTKTAPPAARCFFFGYPVISIFYQFFWLFDLNQVENIPTSWCFTTPKCSSTCRPQPDWVTPPELDGVFLRIEVPRNAAVSPRSRSLSGLGLPPRMCFGMHETWGVG